MVPCIISAQRAVQLLPTRCLICNSSRCGAQCVWTTRNTSPAALPTCKRNNGPQSGHSQQHTLLHRAPPAQSSILNRFRCGLAPHSNAACTTPHHSFAFCSARKQDCHGWTPFLQLKSPTCQVCSSTFCKQPCFQQLHDGAPSVQQSRQCASHASTCILLWVHASRWPASNATRALDAQP